ncbi:MAG: hypothetical protein J6M62_11295 [Selenomonadaceae bacterium]|nr:hypothetical protein [Selenomonadaceae bacterium]MBO6305639.1 hypothetical protein [Selenomonadaceae bacterium]
MSEKALPIPCTKVWDEEDKNVKYWFQKINEELDELKAEVLFVATVDGDIDCIPEYYPSLRKCVKYKEEYEKIAEEAGDAITAITSMLEAMGIDENMRQAAQRRVNEKNKERGRF